MAYRVPNNMQAPKEQPLQYWPQNPSMLNGGINLIEKEWKLPDNQTSNSKNMWWYQGELSKRFGQSVFSYIGTDPIISAHDQLFNDKIIVHIGDKIVAISKE